MSISGTLSGDGFPAGEALVTDAGGNSIFIGVSQAVFGPNEGPFMALWGDSKRKTASVGVSIVVNDKGIFLGVKVRDKVIDAEEWNKRFENRTTQGSPSYRSVSPSDRFGE
ncbi:hypothetical protein QQ020_11995 [Fulvivirgaceae bacterium BMA12]|uniref:Uncharacterized protein n=1 Tax=Agaribacillus aureus TaxID=3051825 RepID=A0ABT8L6B8_9BACT|nr:hypothetical protein [Fulvivirgaceae bacterium BMA12]